MFFIITFSSFSLVVLNSVVVRIVVVIGDKVVGCVPAFVVPIVGAVSILLSASELMVDGVVVNETSAGSVDDVGVKLCAVEPGDCDCDVRSVVDSEVL